MHHKDIIKIITHAIAENSPFLYFILHFYINSYTEVLNWLNIGDAYMLLTLYVLIFSDSINIYLHFVSYLHIDTTQMVEIFPQIRQEPTYST